MDQIKDSDIKNAMSALNQEAREVHSGSLLTAEQVERITAISKETDAEAKASQTSAMIEKLLQENEQSEQKLHSLQSQLGISSEDTGRFLGGERFSSSSQRELQNTLADFEQQTRREVEDAAKQSLPDSSSGGHSKRHHPGHIRI